MPWCRINQAKLRKGWCPLVAVLTLGVLLAQSPCAAQTSNPLTQTAQSLPSLLGSVGSFFNKLKDSTPLEPSANAAEKPADAVDSTEAPEPRALKIVDIEKLSSVANVVLDPTCKVMVQPFGVEDNAASLALYAGKLKGGEFLKKALGQSTTSMDIQKTVKLAAISLNWLPMSLEVELGRKLLAGEEFLDENKNGDIRRSYAEARSMLADILKDVGEATPYNFQIYVRPTSYGNASALPGGIILVDRDLFKKGSNPDHARFVMAHEVAHILQRHQTRIYQARLADGIDSIAGLSKLMLAASNNNLNMLLGQAASLKKLYVSFTEAQELQADSCAVRLMAKQYPSPSLLDAKLEVISQKFGADEPTQTNGPESQDILGHMKFIGDGVFERHPNSGRRRDNLRHASRSVATDSR